MSEDTVKKIVLEHADVQKWVGNSEIKKFVYIPGKIVSIVI